MEDKYHPAETRGGNTENSSEVFRFLFRLVGACVVFVFDLNDKNTMNDLSMIQISSTVLMKPVSYSVPKSLPELYNFIITFNGNQQPIIHDYPVSVPLVAVVLYWMMVFIGPRMMKNRKPFQLRVALMLWNFFLWVLSVGMFLGIAIPVFNFLLNKGWYQVMCMPRGNLYYGVAFFSSWLFALSKYLELIDTLFIILRKRPLNFLHWYHHTTVLVYTWFCLVIMAPPGALFGAVNAFVHSIMYYYYFLTSTGRRPSWGKLVTIIQLTQMVVGISISIIWTIYYVTEEDCPMPHPHAYMLSSLALYASYFILFLNFYIQRYVRKSNIQKSNNNAAPKTKQPSSPKRRKRA